MNERGRAVYFLRIHILDFRYSALPLCGGGGGGTSVRDALLKGRTVRGTYDQEKGTGMVHTGMRCQEFRAVERFLQRR